MSTPYRKLLILNVVFLAVVALVLWRLNVNENRTPAELPIPPEVAALSASASTTPTELIIPTIDLDAKVQLVGVTKTGNMAVPNNFTDVGWYRLGYFPGTAGNAVIAGHLDNGRGTPAVFENLSKLKIGDTVYTMDKAGEKLGFKVTGFQLYDYNNAPVDMIFGSSTTAHLNLITCDGIWNPAKRIYDKRLVVSTEFTGIVSVSRPSVVSTSVSSSSATVTKLKK